MSEQSSNVMCHYRFACLCSFLCLFCFLLSIMSTCTLLIIISRRDFKSAMLFFFPDYLNVSFFFIQLISFKAFISLLEYIDIDSFCSKFIFLCLKS